MDSSKGFCFFRRISSKEDGDIYSKKCRIYRSEFCDDVLSVIEGDAASLFDKINSKSRQIDLVITSPPYPGIHVLYNKWQIFGRRETKLPYDLLEINESGNESEYTLCSRKAKDMTKYFQRFIEIFTSLRRLFNEQTIVALVMAFSDPDSQLDDSRSAMTRAGYTELKMRGSSVVDIIRNVPNRRWYAKLTEKQASSREYLLLFRPNI